MYSFDYRVGASRTGGDGYMTLPSSIDVLQDCSQFWLDSEPIVESHLRECNQALFLTYRQVDVIRLPAFREKLHIATALYDINAYFGSRNTAIYDADGQPCVLSWCLGAFVSLGTGRMERIPKTVQDSITIDPPLDMEYLDRKVGIPDTAFTELDGFTVPPSYIDLNGHMNNARYVEAACNLLPGQCFSRVRVEYRASITMGDVLIPSITSFDGKTYVILRRTDGNAVSVIEFWPPQ